jgi:hypothetical protein
MLNVTETASARLAEILSEEGLPEDTAIRLVHEGQGLSMQPDSERPGDATFQHEGRTVLLLDVQVSELLTDDTLDVEDDKLMLRRPSGDA